MNSFHMIGNTHFDPAWLWTWDEAMASIRATFRAALTRMDEDPDFKYSFCTPAVFEWIENTDPELFGEIQKRVAEGRWDIAAEGWWLQPDCNLPKGESLIRQGLYAQQYLMEKFGMRADTMFNIDSFGHSAMMPQLLSKCGIRNYVFTRPNSDDQPLEDTLFWWNAPDGSRVLTFRCGNANDGCYPPDTAKCLRDRAEALKDAGHDEMIVFGVSDHGGAPTKKSIADIRAMMTELEDADVQFSDVPGFFRRQRSRVTSEFTGELQPRFYGPFSDHAEVKRNNRRGEYALERAERAGFLAAWKCGRKYSADTLRRSWKDVMFNQFHDILGGTCIPQVFADARDQQGRAIRTADEETHFALQTVCRGIRTLGDNEKSVWNVIVFNLTGADFDGICEAEVQWVWEFPWYYGGIELIDEAGNVIPAQVVTERSAIPGFRTRFAFRAQAPALGWRTYAVRQTGRPVEKQLTDPGFASPVRFVVRGDAGDVWCFNTTAGYGADLEAPELIGRRVTEQGDMFTTIKQVWRFRTSTLEEYFTRYADSGAVDWRCRVNWNEKHAVVKLVPAINGGEEVTAAVPAGHVVRPADGREYPVGEYLICGGSTLLLDGIFAYDTRNNVPELTLLRSPIFGDLRIGELDPDIDYQYMGQGIHEARLRILPCAMLPGAASAAAEQFNAPPVIVCEANHDGALPPAFRGFGCEGAHLTALKPAEDGNGAIIRLSEQNGQPAQAAADLAGIHVSTALAPCEIATLRICKDGVVEKTDMLEE